MTKSTRLVQNLTLLVFVLYALVPVYLVFLAAIRSEADLFSGPLTLSWPINFTNFGRIWNEAGFATYFINSVITAVSVTILVLLTAPLAGFAFAKLRFPARKSCSRYSWPASWCRRLR
ncbi:hypothetical protein [Devosia alba]|uniref:hypothetical protein n=1 Tax=Devosia alba TaxID=3152360 RepID=UPI003265AAC7